MFPVKMIMNIPKASVATIENSISSWVKFRDPKNAGSFTAKNAAIPINAIGIAKFLKKELGFMVC